MPENAASARTWALRLSVFFGAQFLIYGVHMSYLPVWLDSRGLTAAEIGAAYSVPLILRIGLTPALAFAADRHQVHREVIVGACALALVVMFALKASTSVVLIVLFVVLMQIALQMVLPMADTLTMAAVTEKGLDYGRIRLWGSLTFILAGYAAGEAVARGGPEIVLQLSITAATLAAAAALWLPRAAPREGGAPRLTLADAIVLARDRRFLLFIATVGAIQSSHAVFYLFGVLHWRSQGLSASYIATLWAIGVVAEIALFWAARWLTPIGPVRMMTYGAIAGIVRWLSMALDPAPWLLVPLQLLHAGTFAASHLGAMHWIGTRIPAKAAGTAQALTSSVTTGIAMSLSMLVSGLLYARFTSGAFFAMTVLCIFGLVLGRLLLKVETPLPPREGP